jgi:hypothetical protein
MTDTDALTEDMVTAAMKVAYPTTPPELLRSAHYDYARRHVARMLDARSGSPLLSRCNPAHLFEGTPTENFNDMIDKGRGQFTHGKCRNGHDRTPENTIVMVADGKTTRRCRICIRGHWAKARKVNVVCEVCGKTLRRYGLRDHLKNVHKIDTPTRAEGGTP